MIENVVLKTIWNLDNRSYYEKRGYKFTDYGDCFEVKESDFTGNSKMEIIVPCVHCGKDVVIGFRTYYKNKSQNTSIMCSDCRKQIRLDILFQRVVDICAAKKYELLTMRDDIIDEHTEIVYICQTHGITHTKIRSLLEGKGCYQCGRDSSAIKMVATTLEARRESLYQKALLSAKQRGYILRSNKEDIVDNTSYIEYICPNHGPHTMRVANFNFGKGCPDCASEYNSKLFRLSPDEAARRIELCGGRLLNKDNYKNQTEKNLSIECFECGRPFTTSLRNFTQHGGQVCSCCSNNISLGEKRIRNYLEANNIIFEHQKWFSDCRDRNPLPFDFYLSEYNTIIEFDGRQHFEEVEYFSYSLAMVRKHDTIKNNYCFENNIHLIRIPYWDYSKIEEILDKELISHKDIV